MNRRKFIQATSAAGAILAIGIPGGFVSAGQAKMKAGSSPRLLSKMKYPIGGCTESGMALFEKGPFGKDPFSIYS